MLPPGMMNRRDLIIIDFFFVEEKEKRKDEFEKEVQMIIKAGEQTAEEMARRARTKNTRQGLVDNEPILSTVRIKNILFYFIIIIFFKERTRFK